MNYKDELNKLYKTSSIVFIFKLIGMFLGYLTTLFIIRYYGNAEMGIYSLAITITTMVLTIINDGFSIFSMKKVSEFFAVNKIPELKDVYIKSLLLLITISLFISIIYFFNIDFIFKKIFQKENLTDDFKILTFIFLPSVLLYFYMNILRGIDKIMIYSLFQNILMPLTLLIFLLINSLLMRKFIILEVYALSTIIISIMVIIVWHKNIKLKIKSSNSFQISTLIKQSSPFLITGIIYAIGASIDILLLAKYTTIEEVGIYSVLFKVSALASIISVALSTTTASKFASYWSNNKLSLIKSLDYKTSKLIFFSTLIVIMILILFSNFILSLFSNEFIEYKSIFFILLMSWLIFSLSPSISNLYNMTKFQSSFALIMSINLLIKLILSYCLISLFGVEGAAYSTLSFNFILVLSLSIYIYRKIDYLPLYIPGIKRSFTND